MAEKVEGMDSLVAFMRAAPTRARDHMVNRLANTSILIFNESQRQVPVRYGVLKGSGHVTEPEINGNDVEIAISYGGAATEYATFVHENLVAQHKPPTKAKFLEDPFNRYADQLPKTLKDTFEGAMVQQYPQAPAKGVSTEAATSTRASHAGRAHKARGMSADEITKALANIKSDRKAGRPQRWQRAH